MTLEDFRQIIPKETEMIRVVPVLDWLGVNLKDPQKKVPEAESKDAVLQISDNISLRYFGKGNEHYRFIWHILYKAEHLATMLSHTRNEKFVKKDMVKVEFKNHLLYTGNLWPVYDDVVSTFALEYKNISRVDIAIDGLNYMVPFVNAYTKQTPGNKVVELKGRGRFTPSILDRRKMMYNSFRLGSMKKKQVTIYNKSQEIIYSQKDYIQKFWVKNRIAEKEMPLQQLGEELKKLKKLNDKDEVDEIFYIHGYDDIYRFELRLSGQMILEIKDFCMDWLKDGNKLMSIVRRLNENFFHFVEHTRADNSKCPDIDFLPYNQFDISPIELQRIERRDDLYKTKLSIKKNVHQLYLGVLLPENYSATEMLIFDVNNYDLKEWFEKKMVEWHKEFSKANPDKAYLTTVRDFLVDLNSKLKSNDEADLLI